MAETSRLLFPSLRFCIFLNSKSESALSTATIWSLRFERSHVDREAVLHVGLEQPLVGFVDLLNGDDFDVGGDVVLAAEVEHLLRLGDAADGRARETATPQDEAEAGDCERLLPARRPA